MIAFERYSDDGGGPERIRREVKIVGYGGHRRCGGRIAVVIWDEVRDVAW